MKRNLISLLLFTINLPLFAQVGANQTDKLQFSFSSESSEYFAKQHILKSILNIPNKSLLEVRFNTVTASSSDEVTIVLYQCEKFNKSGVVFSFWDNGYGFKHLPYIEAKTLTWYLGNLQNDQKSIVKYDSYTESSNHAVFRYDDLIFMLYQRERESNKARIIWGGFNSSLKFSEFKTFDQRFRAFFKRKLRD